MNMAEDKAEGEVRETSSGSSVVEGKVTSGNEQQLETIEEQLKRAQATLLDLQNLKAKLEAERRENRLKELREQEVLASKKIREENSTLRHELKGYQGEINSLKDIIGSLKDDLVRTADRLSEKVDLSLRAIGEPLEESHAKNVHKTVHHKAKPAEPLEHNFFNDHLTPPKIEPELNEHNEHIEEIREEESAVQARPVDSIPIQAEIFEPLEAATPTADSSSEVFAAAPPEAQPAVSENILEAPASTSLEAVAMAETSTSAPRAPLASEAEEPQPQPDELDEDLLEYEAIKRELMAMEEDHIYEKSEVREPSLPMSQPAVAAPIEEPKSDLLKFFKKSASESKPAKAKVPSANIFKNAQNLKHHFWSKKEELAAEPDNVAPISTAEPQPIAATQASEPIVETPQVAQEVPTIQQAAPEPIATVASPVSSAPVPEPSKAAKPIKQLGNMSNVFKKRKKKVVDEIGEDRHSDKKRSGNGGKMLVRAAIFILVLAGAGTAYRISNAEALRQMYNSKAQENVQSTKIKQVPDGFNDIDPTVKYREAYVDAPFADTVWTNYKDVELGISLDYPQNTSYRLKPVGSDNLWFLRKNGYLLKIEKINASGTIEQYARDITDGIKYNIEQLNIRDHKTLHLVLEEDLPVKGNMYLVQMDGAVFYKIWYKTFYPDENADDEQRVKKMLDTLDFIKTKK